jgi:hypothetical protein
MKTLAAVSWFGLVALAGSGARAQTAPPLPAAAVPPSSITAAPPGAAAPFAAPAAPAGSAAGATTVDLPPPRDAQEAAARLLNPPPPADATAQPPPPAAPEVVEEAPSGRDDEAYAADIDNDVAYDDAVAQGYDDGYDPQAYRQFEQTLSPYGTWVDDPTYGRVWQPSQGVVGDDFSPYASNGDWTMTEYGWTWVSAWDWGWAPFHFGRWVRPAGSSWCWVPGTLWSPGWVAWRAGGGFVAWAPLAPRHVTIGAPFGPRSPWRFEAAGALGHPRGRFLTAHAVPHVFSRMNVVSNGRTLAMGGATVRVNAGPVWVGHPPAATPAAAVAPVRLATVAPGALPRVSIQPHAGTPLLTRPWVQPEVHVGSWGGGRPGIGFTTMGGGARPLGAGGRGGAMVGYVGGRSAGFGPGRVYGRSSVVMPQFRGGPAARGMAPAFAGARGGFGGGGPSLFHGAPTGMRAPGGGGFHGFSAPSFSHGPSPAFHGSPAHSFGGFGGRRR